MLPYRRCWLAFGDAHDDAQPVSGHVANASQPRQIAGAVAVIQGIEAVEHKHNALTLARCDRTVRFNEARPPAQSARAW